MLLQKWFSKESDKKFRVTHAWMFKDEELKCLEDKRDQLALPSIEDQNAKDQGKSQKLDGWTYKNVNAVFYPPEGAPLSKEEEIERAKKKRKIIFENTRFKKNPWKVDLQDNSLKETAYKKQEKEAGKVGVDGKELARPQTPSVNGFKFLKVMPSPMPGVMAGDESPMMTWGEVESTPYRLEGCETPLPMNTSGSASFSIQDMPKRDRLAYELAEKNSKFYRDKKGKAVKNARSNIKTPKMGLTERVATMSPAAQRLATTKLGIRLGTDKALRASYTPSPRRTPSRTPMSSRDKKTPSSSRTAIAGAVKTKTPSTPRTPQVSDMMSLTDNLLNLPKSSSTSSPSSSSF